MHAISLSPPDLRPDGASFAGANHAMAALEACGVGIITLDGTLRPILVNEALRALLALPPRTPLTLRLSDLLGRAPSFDPAAIETVVALCRGLDDGAPDAHATLRLPGRSLLLRAVRLDDDCRMITFAEAPPATGSAPPQSDALTGLPTREHFLGILAERLDEAPAASHAVVVIDLERFKTVNDTLGHAAGDALLGLVARRLRGCVRQHDLVARLGGDEFALLVSPGPSPEEVRNQACRVLDILSRPYLVEGQLVTIGARAGIGIAPQDGRVPERLLRAADLALHEARSHGSTRVVLFCQEFETRAQQRRSLEHDLRRALSHDQFELHYQPQVGLKTGGVTGFEALLRWNRPGAGLVSPASFIPLAEETGLIVPIGEWVLRQAATEALSWPNDLSVSVNVSPRQFAEPDRLVDAINATLADTGLSGCRLVVEITESALMRDKEAVLSVLERLRGSGVRTAMDDFGTGYSSLSQLHSFPFDEIKIDRSFIRDGGDLSTQQAIIRAIAALGDGLGMRTIAEGVETAEQLDRMAEGGCTSVQGFLFSRPVPAAAARRLIGQFRRP